jgi:hypothetical protein
VLKGEVLGPVDVAVPLAVSGIVAAACLVYVARMLRAAALK